MRGARFRVPAEDGGLLAEPPPSALDEHLRNNRSRLDSWNHDFQGRRADRLRTQCRQEILRNAQRFLSTNGLDPPPQPSVPPSAPQHPPLFVTGHQPELFHPGVWVKNFATATLARKHQGIGLNLIVDNDLAKSTLVRVPSQVGDRLRLVPIELDRWAGELPHEELAVQDESLFESFGRRVRETLGHLVADPLIETYWPLVVAQGPGPTPRGLRLALARRQLEGNWGVRNLEIPLSQICQSESFLWFAAHLLAQLPTFQDIHNQALAEYRQTYRIRSRNHPVSALSKTGDWLEAPFWIWRQGDPRRRALLVCTGRRTMRLRMAGEDDPFAELPLAADREACCAVEQLHSLESRGIRLRTRALTTTMFCRLLLGDLFIHGIGGAKYDELGDTITERFFRFPPPDFVTLSMTLRLGIPDFPTSESDLASIDRSLRDLKFHPERALTEPLNEEVRKDVIAKRELLSAEAPTRRQRLARLRALRTINERLGEAVKNHRESLEALRRQVVGKLQWNQLAHLRDYPFVLHSRARLQGAMSAVSQRFDS